MRLDLEKVREVIEEYRKLNDMRIEDVEFYENGVKVDIPQQFLDDWKFTGLTLTWFVETGFYREGWKDELLTADLEGSVP